MIGYQIIKTLGSGAAGKVYLAKDKATNEQFAIKEIDIESKDALNHTLKEIENMKKLQHPYIVRYHKSFQENNKLYILMEYIDGGDLASFITDRKNRFLTEDVILKIFIQITVALRYIHEHKIVHRDLKPQNIFMTRVGVVKVGDFGVSRALETTNELMETKVGTPYYLSPEIWNNEPYNSQTDIWSLGCILYELCALKKPFKASNINQLIVAIFNGGYEPLTTRYTEDLRKLVNAMLEQDPKVRPTAADILAIPFITARMQAMVKENESQLNSVHIISPAPRTKKITKKKHKSGGSGKKVGRKKKNVPQIIDKTTELPLPDFDLPRWAIRASKKARTTNCLPVRSINDDPDDEEAVNENNNDPSIENNEEDNNSEEENNEENEWDELKKSTKVLMSLSLSLNSQVLMLPSDPEKAQSEAEEITERLTAKLGEELFEQLKLNINNEFNNTARQYVNIMEDEYPEEVSQIRRLLLLEQLAEADDEE
ncbi:CAMK family protein kinase [Tritrichomonas foetus]|uniref:non-specific serine/threonine protein kinase n=1 Tax=Tritrichomonas foetus TaxID=1144522 RepID=A0A1J4KIC4_9EUKA|nr:CAMK family protein kinase [Tritrichomonas foetus]|eukprot:OHT11129.1 CAMK family protein kinase [Tritrichomonas foetus]